MASPLTAPARKRVLVPLFSQSGQLSDIVAEILEPLRTDDGVDIVVLPLEPLKPYPFPWTFFRFLDAFPESIHEVAPPLKPLALATNDHFDLIILPYQVWYLAPSLPVQALLQDANFQALAKDTAVVTVIGCRNMWHLAQEKVKARLAKMGARLLDNVVLTDQGNTFATFITVPRWLWTGKQTPFLGLPAAGVAPQEIKRARRFGLALGDALSKDCERGNEPLLSGLSAVNAEPSLLVSERAGTRSFMIWGHLVRLMGQPGAFLRVPVLALYIIFLITLIVTVVPLSLLLQRLLRPLLRQKLAAQKSYYEAPSGSGKERLNLYE